MRINYLFSFFSSPDNIVARRENRNSAMQVIQVRQRKQQQLAVIQESYVIHNRICLSLFLFLSHGAIETRSLEINRTSCCRLYVRLVSKSL